MKHTASEAPGSSKVHDKSKSDIIMTAMSSELTVKSCLLNAGLSLDHITELQPAIDDYRITTVADLHELYQNGTPDPDLADVIKFSKIEIKQLTNCLGQALIVSATEPGAGSLDVSASSVVTVSDACSPATHVSEMDRHYNQLLALGNLKHMIAEKTAGAPATLSGTNGLRRHFTKSVRANLDVRELCAECLTDSDNSNTLQISLLQFDNLCAAQGGKTSNGDSAMGYLDSPTGIASAHITQMERNDIKLLKVYYNTESEDRSSDDKKGAKPQSAAHAQHTHRTRSTKFDIFPTEEHSKPVASVSSLQSQ